MSGWNGALDLADEKGQLQAVAFEGEAQARAVIRTSSQKFQRSWWDTYLLSLSVVPTAATLATILKEAEGGDPRRLFALEDRMRAQDAHLESELTKAENALIEAGVTYLPYSAVADDAKTDKEAIEVLAYVKRVLGAPDVNLDLAIVASFHAELKMVGSFHFLTSVMGDRERVDVIEEIPAQRYRLAYETSRPPRWVYSPDGEHWEELEAQGSAVVTRFTDEGTPSLADRGLMRRFLTLWLMKHRGLVWLAGFVEKYGTPFLYLEEDTTDDERIAELTTLLKNMGAQGVGVFPHGGGPKILEVAQRIAQTTPHEQVVNLCDRQISRLCNGHDQSGGVEKDTGSRQSQEFAGAAAHQLGNSRGRKIAFSLRQGVVQPLVARKFGPEVAERSTPTVQIRIAKEKDLKSFCEAVATAVGAGVKTLPTAWFHEETGWRQAAPGEDTIQGLIPPAMPGAPGEPGKVLPFQPKKAAAAGRWGKDLAAAYEARENPADATGEIDDLAELAKRQAAESGTVLLGPYRDIVRGAVDEGLTVAQVLTRVLHRASQEDLLDRDRFTELMEASRMEALRLGTLAVRGGRANG